MYKVLEAVRTFMVQELCHRYSIIFCFYMFIKKKALVGMGMSTMMSVLIQQITVQILTLKLTCINIYKHILLAAVVECGKNSTEEIDFQMMLCISNMLFHYRCTQCFHWREVPNRALNFPYGSKKAFFTTAPVSYEEH